MQIWPWWKKTEGAAELATSMSASSRMTIALLRRARGRPASARLCSSPTRRPTRVEPVNVTIVTFGSRTSASRLGPTGKHVEEAFGQPGAWRISAMMKPPAIGVCGSGLSSTPFTEREGGAIPRIPSASGAFHGGSRLHAIGTRWAMLVCSESVGATSSP